MRMASQMKERLASLNDDAANVRVEGEAGGGIVRVVMNGRHELLEVHIDPAAMVPSEVALVEDLVRAAVNQAGSKATEALKDHVGGMAQKLGLDPSLLNGFFGMGG